MVEDFATFDHNGDGRVDDNDLLFAVTLRSGKPDQNLLLDNCNNNYVAFFVQDDWRVRPDLTLNLGLRYELDSDVKNISGYGDINPIVQPFLQGDRSKDANNFGPRIGFNWAPTDGRFSVHGGYGIYYDQPLIGIFLQNAQVNPPLVANPSILNAQLSNPAAGSSPTSVPPLALIGSSDPCGSSVPPYRASVRKKWSLTHPESNPRVSARRAAPSRRSNETGPRPGNEKA